MKLSGCTKTQWKVISVASAWIWAVLHMCFVKAFPLIANPLIPVRNAMLKLQKQRKRSACLEHLPHQTWVALLSTISPSNRIRWGPVRTSGAEHFYCTSICEGGLGNRNSVHPSICLSVTRMDCDKTKWCTADILILHERAITLLLWHQQWFLGDASFLWNLRSQWPTPPSKNADFDQFPLITSQP